jgi:hypothetical protein
MGQMQMPGMGQMQMPGMGQMQMPGMGQMQMPGGMQMPAGVSNQMASVQPQATLRVTNWKDGKLLDVDNRLVLQQVPNSNPICIGWADANNNEQPLTAELIAVCKQHKIDYRPQGQNAQPTMPAGASQIGMQQGAPQFGMQQGAPQLGMQQGAPQFGMQQGAPQLGGALSLPQMPQFNQQLAAPQNNALGLPQMPSIEQQNQGQSSLQLTNPQLNMGGMAPQLSLSQPIPGQLSTFPQTSQIKPQMQQAPTLTMSNLQSLSLSTPGNVNVGYPPADLSGQASAMNLPIGAPSITDVAHADDAADDDEGDEGEEEDGENAEAGM